MIVVVSLKIYVITRVRIKSLKALNGPEFDFVARLISLLECPQMLNFLNCCIPLQHFQIVRNCTTIVMCPLCQRLSLQLCT